MTGKDGSLQYIDVLSSKSVTFPPRENQNSKNSKIRNPELCPIPPTSPEGFVAQTWFWGGTPLKGDDSYLAYDTERVRFAPKGDNAGLGKTALVTTGAYLLLSP